jgi:hypothetical protein
MHITTSLLSAWFRDRFSSRPTVLCGSERAQKTVAYSFNRPVYHIGKAHQFNQ